MFSCFFNISLWDNYQFDSHLIFIHDSPIWFIHPRFGRRAFFKSSWCLVEAIKTEWTRIGGWKLECFFCVVTWWVKYFENTSLSVSCWEISGTPTPTKCRQEKPKSQTLVHREQFKDLAANSFKVTISRVQQLALEKAGSKLATPAEQLALLNQRRQEKKTKGGTVNHGFTICWHFCIWWYLMCV